MKKFNFKGVLCGFMAGVVVATAVPVLAYNGTRSISATFKNIRIFVDGAELTPRDSAGNVLEPFIYNGSTYLPIRAVGEAVGKSVSYDANTNSVYLGSNNAGSSTSSILQGTKLSPYQTEKCSVETIQMGGVTYRDAVKSGWYWGEEEPLYAYYNLAGAYSSVSGIYGNIDNGGSTDDYGTISFYGDGILLKEYNVKYGDLPKNFTLNVTGISQLTVEVDKVYGFEIGIADMYFK